MKSGLSNALSIIGCSWGIKHKNSTSSYAFHNWLLEDGIRHLIPNCRDHCGRGQEAGVALTVLQKSRQKCWVAFRWFCWFQHQLFCTACDAVSQIFTTARQATSRSSLSLTGTLYLLLECSELCSMVPVP
jgi:hypothetical protein